MSQRGESCQGVEPNAAEDALGVIAKLSGCAEWEYPGQVVRDVELIIKRAEVAEAQVATLREALARVREDVNWMLNERKFLNADVFDYLDAALGEL